MKLSSKSRTFGIPQLTREEMAPEIVKRIRCARLWCYRHCKVLYHPNLRSRFKFQLYTLFVRPILTYGCELWNLNKCDSRKLLRFEADVLVKIYKSKYPHRHPKRLKTDLDDIYESYKRNNVIDYVNCERLSWEILLEYEETALRNSRQLNERTIVWWDDLRQKSHRPQSTNLSSITKSSLKKKRNDIKNCLKIDTSTSSSKKRINPYDGFK